MSKEERNRKADEREAKTGMRQSIGVMIAKIAAGCMFIAVSLEDYGGDMEGFLVGVILGLACIAWGLVPFLMAQQKKKEDALRAKQKHVEQILATPLEKFGADSAEKLAEKYKDK